MSSGEKMYRERSEGNAVCAQVGEWGAREQVAAGVCVCVCVTQRRSPPPTGSAALLCAGPGAGLFSRGRENFPESR